MTLSSTSKCNEVFSQTDLFYICNVMFLTHEKKLNPDGLSKAKPNNVSCRTPFKNYLEIASHLKRVLSIVATVISTGVINIRFIIAMWGNS